ncbi:hypothetical protein BH11ARM2_BH11ARM2_37600 [soil metagenome]
MKEYDWMTAYFANGRLLANISKLRGDRPKHRLMEWTGGRWIDRGAAVIRGASASGRILLLATQETEKAEVVWVAKP